DASHEHSQSAGRAANVSNADPGLQRLQLLLPVVAVDHRGAVLDVLSLNDVGPQTFKTSRDQLRTRNLSARSLVAYVNADAVSGVGIGVMILQLDSNIDRRDVVARRERRYGTE